MTSRFKDLRKAEARNKSSPSFHKNAVSCPYLVDRGAAREPAPTFGIKPGKKHVPLPGFLRKFGGKFGEIVL
jgi:hypothetical protein